MCILLAEAGPTVQGKWIQVLTFCPVGEHIGLDSGSMRDPSKYLRILDSRMCLRRTLLRAADLMGYAL